MNKKIDRIWKKQFDDIMSESFGKYAKYIIQDRALPDIRDGLKPVQRRILYAMYKIGLLPNKQHKKSATTVGEVIGKYHPHGDSSIYDALVRMSQWWKNNIPLVDMQGNNGSIDGDGPAAMRYTESRFSLFGLMMLSNIEKDTVKFVLNFDDTEWEPTVLPSLLPNLLVNGATGIAAGYATNIPPFNLNEIIDAIIMRIDSPNCRLDSLIKVIPGPDFPTGGIIHDENGIKEAYETGRGKIIIRAKMINEIEKYKSRIIIKEIPFETNKSTIIKSIEEIIDENKIVSLNEIRDESDKHGIRIVLEYKGNLNTAEAIKKYLFKHTQLQINYNINNIVINKRKPVQMTLITYLDSYIDHANEIIKKSCSFDLNKSLNRLEIIEGLIKATSIIDKIVQLIRSCKDRDEAIEKLIKMYLFTKKQSEAIVQLRLYRLTNTDINLLEKEKNELNLLISELKKILKDDVYRKNYLKNILKQYKKEFATPRKTEIKQGIEKIIINDVDMIEKKDVILFSTRDGYVKIITQKNITYDDIKNFKLKDNDVISYISGYVSILDKVLFITNFGNYVILPIYKIKEARIRDLGVHINSIITLRDNEKIVFGHIIKTNQTFGNESIVIVTNLGMIKRFSLNDILNVKTIRSSTCISLKEKDFVVDAKLIQNENLQIVLISKLGNALRFNVDEIGIIGLKGMGVRGIKLRNEDNLISCCVINPNTNDTLLLLANHGVKRIKLENLITLTRATMGKSILSQVKSKPYNIINAINCNSTNRYLIAFTKTNEIKIISTVDFPIMDFDSRMSTQFQSHIVFVYLPKEKLIIEKNIKLFSDE